ncbi:MAG: hypothetical protein V2I43_05715 [Parvularcula sp.]|jgi:hypothetical protein|nr:hypothetical protein [Parvularcula sp.]
MTNRRIILLCGETEGDAFRTHLMRLNPEVEVIWVSSAAALDLATRQDCSRTRLISFLTNVIVPRTILARLGPVPYNIHPASPDYPGAHGLSFAIFEDASRFGVTAHEMTAKVDAGPIVMVDWFSLPCDAELVPFGNDVYARAIGVFDMVARHCLMSDEPLPAMNERWASRMCTKKRFRELMSAERYLLPGDQERLRRACGPHLKGIARRHG